MGDRILSSIICPPNTIYCIDPIADFSLAKHHLDSGRPAARRSQMCLSKTNISINNAGLADETAFSLCNRSRGKYTILCHCEAFFKGRGNLNRYLLDCFVVILLAMTPRTQLVRCERLPHFQDAVYKSPFLILIHGFAKGDTMSTSLRRRWLT